MNARNLVMTCRHSKIAYDNLDTIHKNLIGIVKTYDGASKKKHDAQGFLHYPGKKSIYVSYRGTVNMADIFDNIDIRQQSLLDSKIKVHKGFYEQFFSIEEDITKDIKDIISSYDIHNIIFTGHSLGGTLAIISSPYYGKMFNKLYNIVTHTYGTVPVGNNYFIEWFKKYVDHNVRVESENDIVPLIPIGEFMHVPNAILVKHDGSYEINCKQQPFSYLELLKMIMHKENWVQINKDHSCETYANNIKYLCDNTSW